MPATLGWSIETTLQEVADVMSKQYNLSFSLSYHDANQTVSAASGFTDAGLGMGSPSQKATVSDKYVWGSTTKMFTAAAVLQLVDRGVVALDDPAAKHIDPILQRLNGTTLADHFGEAVGALEAALRAGVPKNRVYEALSINLNSEELALGLIEYYTYRQVLLIAMYGT